MSIAQPILREMSIERALIWAFGDEKAQLDFAEEAGHAPARRGVDPIAVMMYRAQLGVEVDGGGYSYPHDDADVIASFVAALRDKRMAAQIAELARAGIRPDWMRDATPRCVPVAWQAPNQYGHRAKTEVYGTIETEWRGKKTKREIVFCPVRYVPTAAQIAARRRNYIDWWQTLSELQFNIRMWGRLNKIAVTLEMPPLEPWKVRG